MINNLQTSKMIDLFEKKNKKQKTKHTDEPHQQISKSVKKGVNTSLKKDKKSWFHYNVAMQIY